jgi:hypothetical protein
MVSTSTLTTPQTLLEAVNDLLKAVRISGVMSLNATEINEDASSAKLALDSAAREVQQEGWEFNTDWNITLDPDPTTGYVTLPNNGIKVRSTRDQSKRYVLRGRRLYDNGTHTYALHKSVTVDLVVALPFEDMPEAIKRYVTGLAARRWCIPRLPGGVTFQYTEEFVNAALSQARTEDDEMADLTLKDTSPHFFQMSKGRRRLT